VPVIHRGSFLELAKEENQRSPADPGSLGKWPVNAYKNTITEQCSDGALNVGVLLHWYSNKDLDEQVSHCTKSNSSPTTASVYMHCRLCIHHWHIFAGLDA